MLIKERSKKGKGKGKERPQDKAAQELTEEVLLSLARCGCHPIVQLARYALGDVVGLKLMTQEEYDSDPIYDPDGILIQRSGKNMALDILPTRIRYEANKELATYLWSKAKPTEVGKGAGNDEAIPVTFYMPDNGRLTHETDTESESITVEIL